MLDRTISCLVALCLALLVWLYLRSRDREMLDNVQIPVQVTVAPGQADHYDLEVGGASQVLASFVGPPSRMRELRGMLQRGELRIDVIVTVPDSRLEDNRYQETLRIDVADIHPPPGVQPLVVEGRNRIPVTLHRLAEQRLPVHYQAAAEDRVAQATLEPTTVLVRGPKEVLERVKSINTQPHALPAR